MSFAGSVRYPLRKSAAKASSDPSLAPHPPACFTEGMPERVPAATLLLLRPAPDGVEVALLRRNPKLPFLGGFWVFPGGRCELNEDPAAAAAREAFEETGVLLGARPGPPDVEQARTDLIRGESGWEGEWADRGADLVRCGLWLTPPFSVRRFETVFFMAWAPTGAQLVPPPAAADPRGPELLETVWIRPTAALERWARDEWLLAPPTRVTLSALADQLGTEAAPEQTISWLEGVASAVAASHPENAEWPGWIDFRPGIRLLPLRTPTLLPATHTNCLVVGDGSEVVAIDPASPYPDEQERLAALIEELAQGGQRLREVILTHHHPDHMGGAADLARRFGVPIAAHARTREILAGQLVVTRDLADGELIELPADREGALPRRLRCVLTEGHADGHLMFFEEVTQCVIAGDMVAGVGTILIDPPEGRMLDYLESLRRLADLGATLLYPSHGPPIGDPRAYAEHYIAHRLGREAKIVAALEMTGPSEIEGLLPHAYSDKPPAIYPLAKRAAWAHLLKLEAEGRARLEGSLWSLVT